MKLRNATLTAIKATAAIKARKDLACRTLDQLKTKIESDDPYRLSHYADAVYALIANPEPFDRINLSHLAPELAWVKAELEWTLESAWNFFDLNEALIDENSDPRPESDEKLAYVSDGTEEFWVLKSALDEKIDPIVAIEGDFGYLHAYELWCRHAIVD